MYQYNPLRDFEQIARHFGKAIMDAQKEENQSPAEEKTFFKPRTDVLEDPSNLYFHIELPGVKKEDVKITISSENILTITGKKNSQIPENANICCRRERRFGDFQRSFQLPEYANVENVAAKYDAGMLFITIARKVEVRPKENVINID